MKFIKNGLPSTKIVDDVFKIANKANEDILKNGKDNVINATIGTLYDENNELVVYDTIYNTYKLIDNKHHASYSSCFTGDPKFIDAIDKFIFSDIKITLNYNIIATNGGTGAINMALMNQCNSNEIVLGPSIGWGSYKVMCEQHSLKYDTYNLFKEDKFDLDNFKEKCIETINIQNKLVLIINDPCHNPTGLSMGNELWNEVITFLNSFKDTPIIIINDVAYIDYSYNLKESRRYMETFNKCNSNIFINITFSCSKVFSFYGVRLGCLITCHKDMDILNQVYDANERACRAIFSNVTNGGMKTIADVLNNHKEIYLKEKSNYIDLLQKRFDLFIEQSKQCNLELYPYNEGFFITIKVLDNNLRDTMHNTLMDNHIYTIKVNQGLRVAICSLTLNDIMGLPQKIKDIISNI